MVERVGELPSGTVTFLFTDIEGSTRALHDLGDAYAEALAEHRRLLREAFARHGGVEVDTQGDAFFVAFARASDAVAAAAEGQRALADSSALRVRMGIHTGEPIVTPEGYVGLDVVRAARICGAAHGGQVLLSEQTARLAGDGVRDLGSHRLKDLSEPRHLYQLGDASFPRLRTLWQTNLPVQPSALIGREREAAEVAALLGGHRLVTLTGAGGSGKTRLALHVAAEQSESFTDGVWFVSLADVGDVVTATATIAERLGVASLPEGLAGMSTLVVLDNLEHLLELAPLIAECLESAPGLTVLATSRERLALRGEQEFPVPLLETAAAVSLFVARARELDPEFVPDPAVDEICARLDGLPLALELAAARTKVLTTGRIAERLGTALDLLRAASRDAPPRQRTLRATIDWSYELLAPRERELFRSLGVFRKSFTLEAAEDIAGATVDELASLVDKSLLRRTGEGRFFLLDTLRAYAREKLDESGDAPELRARHAAWFLQRAGERGVDLYETNVPDEALEWFSQELDNLRAALDTFRDEGSIDDEITLTIACYAVWLWRTHWREARLRIGDLLERAGVDAPPRLVWVAGVFAWREGDFDAARELAHATLARVEAVERADRERLYAHVLVAISTPDPDLARPEYERAAALARAIEDDGALTVIVNALGNLALEAEDFESARAYFGESLRFARSTGAPGPVANTLVDLATVELASGEPERAGALYREALPLAHNWGDQTLLWIFEGAAAVLLSRGDAAAAARLLGAGDACRERLGRPPPYAVAEAIRARTAAAAMTELGDEAYDAARAPGLALDAHAAAAETERLLAGGAATVANTLEPWP